MKTSNYIIIVFFIAVLGGMLWLFVAAKKHKENLEIIENKEFALPEFSVIVAEPGTVCSIAPGDKNNLTFKPNQDSIRYMEAEKIFRVNGDSLFILYKSTDRDGINISTGKPLSGINANHARISVYAKGEERFAASTFSVTAIDSADIYLNNLQAKILILDSEVSTIRVLSDKIDNVSVKLRRCSMCSIHGNRLPNNISLEKDECSRYHFQ